jgi:hypothetical protein
MLCIGIFTLFNQDNIRVENRDANGYPKPENPMDFTRYEGEYEMISLPAGTLVCKNIYPLSKQI